MAQPFSSTRASPPTSVAEGCRAAFRRAATCEVERWFRVAGRPVLFRFAGPGLLPVVEPALAHLASGPAAVPELIVHLWDTATTTAGPPPLPAHQDPSPGAVYLYDDAAVRAVYRPGHGSMSVLEQQGTNAWHWVSDPARVPYWDVSAPGRDILHWWSAARGLQLVHAGAVGNRAGAVLLVGKGGSGKSTATLACLGAGLRYLGDDYVIVDPAPPTVHSVYNSGKLDVDHLVRFPELLPGVWNAPGPGEKAVAFLHRRHPDRFPASLPLRAVLVPRVAGGGPTWMGPASHAEALLAFAPSTVFQVHGGRREAMAAMARVVGQLPCRELGLGPDLDAVGPLVADLLEGLVRG